ncbi:MAG: hypothetical protein ACTS22_00730 [Phycisphaerales bacterium]
MASDQHDATPARPRIDACVLLAGGLVPSPLVEEAGRPVLELWLTARQTVFNRWCDVLFDATSTPHGSRDTRPTIHVVHSGPPFAPRDDFRDPRFEVRTQGEAGKFRGPAGVLRDVTESYDENAVVLVGEAARYIAGSLDQFLADWQRSACDVLVACHSDGDPTGLLLLRRGALELVPQEGFMDLKEQWLPKLLRAGLKIWTSETRDFQPYPLRNREQFLRASAFAAGAPLEGIDRASVLGPPKLLRPGSDRSRVAASARVGSDAVIADAVVMPDARIGDRAVVVRSIVCQGAVVPDGAEVVDRVIPAAA